VFDAIVQSSSSSEIIQQLLGDHVALCPATKTRQQTEISDQRTSCDRSSWDNLLIRCPLWVKLFLVSKITVTQNNDGPANTTQKQHIAFKFVTSLAVLSCKRPQHYVPQQYVARMRRKCGGQPKSNVVVTILFWNKKERIYESKER